MNILIVDDHPMTVSGYQESLSHLNILPDELHFCKVYSCEEAYKKIQNVSNFELAIIDFGLPPYPDNKITNGSDLAKVIKERHPKCKIIIITAHTDIITVYDIFKNTKPEGLIIKNDLTPQNLPVAILEILAGNQFHSPTAKKLIQEIWKKEIMVDNTNREILQYLAKGYKIKDIERITTISMSTVQRRIAQMKDVFNVTDESSLVTEAYLKGFL